MNPHAGSWFGLPDFGITEKIGSFLGAPTTAQGGSNIWQGSPTSASSGQTQQDQQPATFSGTGTPPPLSNGQSSYVQSGGSNTRTNTPAGNNSTNSFTNAANAGADAQLQSLNTEYDRNKDYLLSQMGSLGGQRDSALNALDTQLNGVKNTIGSQRTQAQQNTDSQIEQAGNTARGTQQSNRNVLRALGILNSSAAGELLSKPINQYDSQRADLGQQLQNRFGQLDDYLNQRIAEHQNAYQSVVQQYNDLTSKIQSDLRFNERDRADAIKSANAALQQNIASIQSSAQQYQQAVDAQKQQYASAFSNLSANPYAPQYDASAIQNTGITTGNQQVSSPNIFDEQKKRQGDFGGGLLSGLG